MRSTVESALNNIDFNYQILKDEHHQVIIKLGVGLENGRCDTFIDIRPEPQQVLIFTVCPATAPANQRVRISEFLARANRGLIVGNFEVDMDDGELSYKTSYLYDNTFPNSEDVFLKNLYAGFHMMDRYLPGIMSVLYANISPASAIHQIENTTNPSSN